MNNKTLDTKSVIHQIKNQPAIWDKTSDEYKAKIAKSEAWIQVYKSLLPDYDSLGKTEQHEFGISVVKKWNNVRDAYVKSLKCKRDYKYAKYLKFLNVLSKSQDRYVNHFEDDQLMHEDNEQNEVQVDWESDVFVNINESSFSDPLIKKFKRSSSDVQENVNESIATVLQRLIEKEDDEDRAFFRSITPTVKMLSTDGKFEFRIQVLNLLQKLKKKDESGQLRSKQESDDDN